MLKIILTVGIPCSGKSTWSKEELRRNPNAIRINRDDIRALTCNSVYSAENESLALSIRDHIISKGLKQGRDILCDDTNINRRNFEDICKLADKVGVECMVLEKPFYIDIAEALERNSKREGVAKVPEEVIHKMWKQSGKESHKFYKPRTKICGSKIVNINNIIENKEVITNPSLQWCVIADLDGSLSLFNSIKKDGSIDMRFKGAQIRNPYDASKSDEDMLNEPLAEILESFYVKGYKIILCSGRTEEYKPQTLAFLNKHLSVQYELFMRKIGDTRSDDIIKKEIFDFNIKDKFNVFCVFDDRLKVCKMWHDLGIMLFRIGDPCSDF